MISQRIEFENLNNTRDLGGMTGADGRKIKPGKLFRSGSLYPANNRDLEKLGSLIDLSVDFRSVQECTEKPDPLIPGVTSLHMPVLEEKRAGVTRDEASFEEVQQKMMADSEVAKHYMSVTYNGFITNQHSVSQYDRFIHMLLEDHPKGILWHCTAGKDRTGFAAVIIQELLGVSREDIRADYLLTNACLEEETQGLIKMILAQTGAEPRNGEKAIRYIFGAHEFYLDTAYNAVENHYGSFENYLRQGLHITQEEQDAFRNLYLG